ncbi:hypothetical protein SI65_06788 [Aspergillus cristatus]|uniref:PH domain-containing protein n=1 Tax=Aspergillus cristatus TaxID=573508 RepID=A0A1E3BAJ5_ASPCR|nr:hypothetical protein SI65_06788 [Aspergillus cristatus]
MDRPLVTSVPALSEGHPKNAKSSNDTKLQPLHPSSPLRNGEIGFGTISPIENGSFAFDRVLKTGKVHRRIKHKRAFKATWKSGHLVLRPNLLSVYKDEEATRLKLSITLSEVTAVAPFKSPRSKRQHLFAIYCPTGNYRFQAESQKDAEDWIQRIRSETRLDEEEAAFLALTKKKKSQKSAAKPSGDDSTSTSSRPSSPELGTSLSFNSQARQFAYPLDFSANDMTSEWSDGPSNNTNLRSKRSAHNLASSAQKTGQSQPPLPREGNRNADVGILRDPERVLCNGYLQCLRTKGGVRTWKRYWVVLRPRSLGFYKNEKEYCAVKVIPMSQVIEAADVDPVSRSKNFCLQVIAEEKSYQLCTPDEESLAKWLGGLKSIIIARKKLEASVSATA